MGQGPDSPCQSRAGLARGDKTTCKVLHPPRVTKKADQTRRQSRMAFVRGRAGNRSVCCGCRGSRPEVNESGAGLTVPVPRGTGTHGQGEEQLSEKFCWFIKVMSK